MKVGGGGKKGGAGGVKGTGGAGNVGKTQGAGFAGKVDKAESLVAPSGVVGSSNVQGPDPVTAQTLDIARQLKNGQIKSREEATQKLVADILKEKVRLQSKALTQKITDQLGNDPRIASALERLWAKAE
jgi:hypothetical protein